MLFCAALAARLETGGTAAAQSSAQLVQHARTVSIIVRVHSLEGVCVTMMMHQAAVRRANYIFAQIVTRVTRARAR